MVARDAECWQENSVSIIWRAADGTAARFPVSPTPPEE